MSRSHTQYLHWWAHNVIAHPLLVLWPSAGEWLHEYTARRMGRGPDSAHNS